MKVDIKTPCTVAWDEWKEGQTVRFCESCKLNVHNLSALSEREAKALMKNRKGRLCVFFYQKHDGSIVTDNCPKALRAVRNRIKAVASVVFLFLASSVFVQFVNAQGLTGTPVDPRYGQGGIGPVDPRYGSSGEVGLMADPDGKPQFVSWTLTAITLLIAFFVPIAPERKSNLKLLVLEFLALAALPVLVYLCTQHLIDLWFPNS